MGFHHQIDRGFRLKFSHHPILWIVVMWLKQSGQIIIFH